MKQLNIVVIFAIVSGGVNVPKTFAQATPGPPPSTESVLDDPRTATEIPTKRKLPTDSTVEVKRKETDKQIQDRLNRIAHSQDVFKKVNVKVTEGIVTLNGEVDEEAYAKSFSGLSEKVEGVIGVVDGLKITSEKKTGLRLAQAEIDSLVHKFFKFLPYLASSFIILLITIAIGYGTYRLWFALLSRKLVNRQLLVPHLAKIFTLPVFLFGAYLILQIGGAAGLAATLVGGTGVLGIVIGLAGKNVLENVLASFMLTLRNPFRIGDEVTIADQSGIVYKMDSRCTMLLTYDGILVQIPNSTVLGAVIKNLTSHPVNRISFNVRVTSKVGFSCFKEIFDKSIALNAKSILADPKQKALITDISYGTAIVQCVFWADTSKVNANEVKSSVLHSILHFMKHANDESKTHNNEDETLQSVERSIQESSEQPTAKKVLEDRRSQVKSPD